MPNGFCYYDISYSFTNQTEYTFSKLFLLYFQFSNKKLSDRINNTSVRNQENPKAIPRSSLNITLFMQKDSAKEYNLGL